MDRLVSDVAVPGAILRLDENARLPACAAGLGSKRVLESGIAHGRTLEYSLADDALIYGTPDPVTLRAIIGEQTFKVYGLDLKDGVLTPGMAVIAGVKVEVQKPIEGVDEGAHLTPAGINYIGVGLDVANGYSVDELFRLSHLLALAPVEGNGSNILVGDDVVVDKPIKSDHVVIFARGTCTINATIDVSASCTGDGLYGGAGSLPEPGAMFASVGDAPVSRAKLGELSQVIAEAGASPSAQNVSCLGVPGLTRHLAGQGASGAPVTSANGATWSAKAGGSVVIVAKHIIVNAPIKAAGEPGREFTSIENKAYGKAGGGGGGVVLLRSIRSEINASIDVSGFAPGWWRAVKV